MMIKSRRDSGTRGVVCFFGPDGSGKSTLARMLRDVMVMRGIDAVIVWVRGTHTIASFIAKFVSLVGRDLRSEYACNPYYGICIRGHSRYFWAVIEVVSITPVIVHRFVLTRMRHDLVIAERSPPDLIIWLLLTFGGERPPRFALEYSVAVTRRVCDKLIYVRADEDVLIKRRPEEDWRIAFELPIYDGLAKVLGAKTVDTGDKSPEEALDEVLGVVMDDE